MPPVTNPNYSGPRVLTNQQRQIGAQEFGRLGQGAWGRLTPQQRGEIRGQFDPSGQSLQQRGLTAKSQKPTPGPAGAKPTAAAPAPAPAAAAKPGKPQAGPPGSQPTQPQTFQGFLNTQFGAGNPFGMQGNYTDPNNPLYAAATRNYQQGLAGTRERFGSSGLGDSGREALAEGDAAANYGAQIAQIGEQARQNDANRALAATGQGQNYNLAANQQLSQTGQMLNQIGLTEQNLPMIAPLMQLLQTFFQGDSTGTTGSSTASNPWSFA